MDVPKSGEFAHIGKSVVIKGELSGSEDLYLDGQVDGSILLKGNNLTVGPNGQVKANVSAKGVIVQGKLEGNLQASDRVELRKSAIVMGDIATQRIAIEEGAYLKGKVQILAAGKFSLNHDRLPNMCKFSTLGHIHERNLLGLIAGGLWNLDRRWLRCCVISGSPRRRSPGSMGREVPILNYPCAETACFLMAPKARYLR